jgi:antitoxin component HigA of HigAB toxin-antitoxin module
VEAYETKHHMEQVGMSRKELEALLGGRGRVSEILSPKSAASR